MPHVAISLYPGRSEDFKQEVAQKLKTYLEGECGFNPDTVSISLHELNPENFTEAINSSYEEHELYLSSKHIPSEI